MSNNRWDWLEGVRPQTPVEWAVTQMARILLKELSSWPPDIDWAHAGAEQRYAALFAADAQMPAYAAFEQAIVRAAWDLAHNEQALDHYQRNHLLQIACPGAYDRLASAFIESYLTEALLELIERTENRVKRRDALACLEQLGVMLRSARN